MNQYNRSTTINCSDQSDAPIDLIYLFMQIWRGKQVIIACTVIAIIIAATFAFTTEEKWTSEALITYPDSSQITNFAHAMVGLYSQDNAITNAQELFFNRFNSVIFALSGQLGNQEKPESLIITPAVKDQPFSLKISYTAKNATDAQKALTTYIQQSNQRVVNEIDADLQTNINSKIGDLKEDIAIKEKIFQEIKDNHLAIPDQTLIAADQSNTKNTITQQAETQAEHTMRALSYNAASSTITNEGTRQLTLGESYYSSRQALLAISLLKAKPASTYSFRYVMEPSLPIHSNTPQKPLIIILGALVGIIIGSGFVLVRSALRTYSR